MIGRTLKGNETKRCRAIIVKLSSQPTSVQVRITEFIQTIIFTEFSRKLS